MRDLSDVGTLDVEHIQEKWMTWIKEQLKHELRNGVPAEVHQALAVCADDEYARKVASAV